MIILQGKGNRPWFTTVVCTNRGYGRCGCGAVLLVRKEDLFRTHEGGAISFRCLSCWALNTLPNLADLKDEEVPVLPIQLEGRHVQQGK